MQRYLVTNVYNGLNLRESASIQGQLIANMPFATVCDLLLDTGTKWKKVRATVNGTVLEGYASDLYLTDVKSDAVSRLIQSVMHYWTLFDRGRGLENIEPYKSHVLQMWDELGMGRPPNNNTSHKYWPWSAAGISAFVRRAGNYNGFKYHLKHSYFIHDSIVKKNAGLNAPFWGYPINSKRPEVGDLIAQWRITRRDYQYAATHEDFTSHTDVVCQIINGKVRAIGANVPTDTVHVKVYRLTPDGFLAGERNEIAILKNKAQ